MLCCYFDFYFNVMRETFIYKYRMIVVMVDLFLVYWNRSSTIGSRPEHHISDSDSETESTVNVPPKFVTKATSHLCTLPSYAAPIKGLNSCKSSSFVAHQLSSTSQTSMDSCKSNEGVPLIAPVSDFIMLPGSFEIILCIDNREFYGG